ncbi:MAG: FAD binding domain-containing protein, partial [Actinomycetes bacterium]
MRGDEVGGGSGEDGFGPDGSGLDGFTAPATVEEAVEALGAPDALAVGGGTSVGLLIGHGLVAPATLVWLGRIPELTRIRREGDRLVVGAG